MNTDVVGCEALIKIKPLASLAASRRVCLFCLLQHLRNDSQDVPELGKNMTYDGELAASLIKEGSFRGIQELAAQHNREMHATNGNIAIVHKDDASRADVITNCVTASQRPVKHRSVVEQTEDSKNRLFSNEMPAYVASNSHTVGVALVDSGPTRHQIYWYTTLAQPEPEPQTVEPQPGPSRPRADSLTRIPVPVPDKGKGKGKRTVAPGGILIVEPSRPQSEPATPVVPPLALSEIVQDDKSQGGCDELESVGTGGSAACETPTMRGARLLRQWRYMRGEHAHRDMRALLARMRKGQKEQKKVVPPYYSVDTDRPHNGLVPRQLTWIGVGVDSGQNRGSCTLTALATSMTSSNDAIDTRDGRVNCRFPAQVWRYIADSPLLQETMVHGSGQVNADIRPGLLKIRLYDMLRENSMRYPTGTEWGVPLNAEIPGTITLDPEVNDQWRFVAVTPRYLDEVLARGLNHIPTLLHGNWSLDDPSVAVVVLDRSGLNQDMAWYCQIVMAAPYPLVRLEELFVVTGPGGEADLRLTGMVRNESTITMDNGKRRFIFVTTKEIGNLTIGTREIIVGQLGAGRAPEPLASESMVPLVTQAMNSLLASTQPLKLYLTSWISNRLTVSNVAWDEIEDIATWGCFRFIPQTEVVVPAVGARTVERLPQAYRRNEYGTRALARFEETQEHDFYYHDDAVTLCDQQFVSREEAHEFPALVLGQWNNQLELATGLKVCLYNPESVGGPEAASQSSQVLDNWEWAILRRRAYEEYKRACGIGDEPVSRELMTANPHYWDTIINGQGGSYDSVKQIGAHLIDGIKPQQMHWDVNELVVDRSTTATGVRTPLSINMSECMRQGRIIVAEPGSLELLTNVGGGWLESRYGCGVGGIQDNVKLERALGRVNALNLEQEDILYCTKPLNAQVDTYAMRVSTAVTTIVAHNMGWRGNVRPVPRPFITAPAYGWGLRVQIRDYQQGDYMLPTFSPSLIGQLESGEMTQIKMWHARLRETTSAGTSNEYIYAPMGVPGLAPRTKGKTQESTTNPSGFMTEGHTSTGSCK